MNNQRSVVLYIAMSLDGYIASLNYGLEFLSPIEDKDQDYSYSDFINSVDTIIVGRTTYEKMLDMGYDYPHTNKDVYVITHTPRPATDSAVFYAGNLKDLIFDLKSKKGKDIYVDGGAKVVHELLKENLIDEFCLSVVPTLLGEGIPLFRSGRPELNLKLVSTKLYNKGLVQLHYLKA
jgi:dihydrofolate reductase